MLGEVTKLLRLEIGMLSPVNGVDAALQKMYFILYFVSASPFNPTLGKVDCRIDPFLKGRAYLTFWKTWSSLIHSRELS